MSLLLVEISGRVRPRRKEEEDDETEDERRNTFDHEQDPPSGDAGVDVRHSLDWRKNKSEPLKSRQKRLKTYISDQTTKCSSEHSTTNKD